jgi:hypothetical protein
VLPFAEIETLLRGQRTLDDGAGISLHDANNSFIRANPSGDSTSS